MGSIGEATGLTHIDTEDNTIEGVLKKKSSMFAWKRHFVASRRGGSGWRVRAIVSRVS